VLTGVRQRPLTTFLFATALLVASPPAYAGAPTDRLREFFAKVNAILADPATEDRPLERVARVRRLVADVADMHAAAAAALGAEWERRTPAERDEFVGLFTELLERAYVGRLAGAVRSGGGVMMTYGDEEHEGEEAKVTTALRGVGPDLRVEYRMTVRAGRWRVRDIVVDGVSTVENYRAQFTRVLQHGSYPALVNVLRDKLAAEGLMFARSERLVAARPAAAPPAEREPPAVDPQSVAVAAPSVRAPAPAPVPVAAVVPRREPPRRPVSRPEPVMRPASPPVVAVSRAPLAPPPAPAVAPVEASASTVVGAPDPLPALLGALAVGLVGAGAAALLRRRTVRSARARDEAELDAPGDERHDGPRDVADFPLWVASQVLPRRLEVVQRLRRLERREAVRRR
jgi:phospholipid transport system substrate-binding protein